ncbi:hypothetical protein EV121DRAFT_294281 [Schizophyllum commune]
MPPPIPRILTAPQAALDTFEARSHLLGRLAYRIRVAVVGSVVLKNGKSTSTVLRSAPVPLGDRFDSSSSSTGGDESHARSGAERRCVSEFHKPGPALKQRINVPRARVNLTDIAIPPPFSLPLAASRTPFVPA